MMTIPHIGELTAAGRRLEYRRIAATHGGAPTVVLLHEGLGSLALWRDFPARLAAASGCGVVAYSRYGYGGSAPLEGPRGIDYMHREALDGLPEILAALAIERPLLYGHSDGASIALIHAGAGHPVAGLILEAPHVFVEAVTVASIAAAGRTFASGDLLRRMARYHADPERTFKGWHDIWLDPAFRAWNIRDSLPAIACPVLMIQGEDDEYGTAAQLDAIGSGVAGPVERLMLPGCRHAPHRERPDAVLAAVTGFLERHSLTRARADAAAT